MFTQIKGIAVAFATIIFLIGVTPTALAQSKVSVDLDILEQTLLKNKIIGEHSFWMAENVIKLKFEADKTKVTIRYSGESELHQYSCDFDGIVTAYEGTPAPDHWLHVFYIAGTSTWSDTEMPSFGTKYLTGVVSAKDYQGDDKDYVSYITYNKPEYPPCTFSGIRLVGGTSAK
jgi:hypothetical protein